MSDGHLWFSIVARPTSSSFSRTDRLTCAFVLLCLTMLMNIMYYGMASASTGNQLVIGPFSLSQSQIVIGVMTNLIIFPPSFLLLQIFRKSRRRKTRVVKLKEHINEVINEHSSNLEFIDETSKDEAKEGNKKSIKMKKQFSLPWWFKIIGYLLSFCIVSVCVFFIIVKGIAFGDDLCRQWLTSFLISVLTSVFLTQPIQVALLSIFFVLLFRKSNDDKDLEYDYHDDGKPINKIKFKKHAAKTKFMSFFKPMEQNNNILLSEMRKQRELENKTLSMLKKILVYAIFPVCSISSELFKDRPALLQIPNTASESSLAQHHSCSNS